MIHPQIKPIRFLTDFLSYLKFLKHQLLPIESPLQLAIQKNDIQLFDRLLKEGLIPKNQTLLTSAMNFAVTSENVEALKILLAIEGCDPNQFDKNGDNPLFIATRKGNVEIVETLLNNSKVDPNTQDSKFKMTALMMVKTLNVVEAFLRCDRVDKNLKDLEGNSALAWAIVLNRPQIVKALLPFYVAPNPNEVSVKDSIWFLAKKIGFISAAKQIKNLSGKESIDWSKKMVTQLSHQFSIKGTAQLETKSGKEVPIDLEGSPPRIWWNIMSKSIDNRIGLPPQKRQQLSNMLQLASNIENATPKNLLASFREGNPILLPTGFLGHSVEILLTPSVGNQPARLFLCNRGGLSKAPIEVFSINEKGLTEKLLDLIHKQATGPDENYQRVIDAIVKQLVATKDPMSSQLEMAFNNLPHQTVGNCSWVSAETAVLAAMVSMQVETGGNTDEKIKKGIREFEQWYCNMRVNTLENYLIGTILNKKGILNHSIVMNSFQELWKLRIKDKDLIEHIEVMESLYSKGLSPSGLKQFKTQKVASTELGRGQTLGSTKMYQFLK